MKHLRILTAALVTLTATTLHATEPNISVKPADAAIQTTHQPGGISTATSGLITVDTRDNHVFSIKTLGEKPKDILMVLKVGKDNTVTMDKVTCTSGKLSKVEYSMKDGLTCVIDTGIADEKVIFTDLQLRTEIAKHDFAKKLPDGYSILIAPSDKVPSQTSASANLGASKGT